MSNGTGGLSLPGLFVFCLCVFVFLFVCLFVEVGFLVIGFLFVEQWDHWHCVVFARFVGFFVGWVFVCLYSFVCVFACLFVCLFVSLFLFECFCFFVC